MGKNNRKRKQAGKDRRFAYLQGCQRHNLKAKAKTWLPERITNVAGRVTEIMFWMSVLMTATMLAKLHSRNPAVFATVIAGGTAGFTTLANQAVAVSVRAARVGPQIARRS